MPDRYHGLRMAGRLIAMIAAAAAGVAAGTGVLALAIVRWAGGCAA